MRWQIREFVWQVATTGTTIDKIDSAGAATRVSPTSGTCIFTSHKCLCTSNPEVNDTRLRCVCM